MKQNTENNSSSYDARFLDKTSEKLLHFFSRAASELGTSLDWNVTLHQLCSIFSPALSEYCSIWTMQPNGQLIEQKRADAHSEISDLIEIEIKWVTENSSSRIKAASANSCYLLTVPMRFKNELNGAIVLINFKKDFQEVDLVIAQELAHRAAMVLEHSRVYKELKTAEEHLQNMRDVADSASKTKSMFLANMSHEIRTPLTAILGFLDLILTSQENPSMQSLDLGERVRANGAHLLRLIDQILDLSKIESGKIEIFSEKLNLGELLRDVHSTLILQAQKKGIRLHFKLDSPVPVFILADPTRLKQILINMVGNAIKFTEIGSVTVAVSYSAAEARINFVIQDSGIGLTAEQKARIFKPFMQGDVSHTKRFGGTGLGLTLSRKFAQHMCGEITLVDSVLGSGTSFLVTIGSGHLEDVPLTNTIWKKEPKKKMTRASEPSISLKGCRILLAEDSVDNQMIIDMILTKAGALVEIASDGIEAFEKAQKKQFDIILMDIQLPLMDGHLVSKKLRANHYIGPIIALTAHALKAERDQSIAAGCNAHLTKPIDKNLLISTISSYL